MLFPELKELIKLKSLIMNGDLAPDKSANRMQGDYASLFHGLGVEFETVRPYVVGDDVRYIDWRVTARSGKPHVKTFRAESDRNVLVVVDANAYMRFGTRGTFKSVQAAKTAALLCWKSLQQQDRIGGLVFGDIPKGMQYFAPDKTDRSVLRLCKLLCSTEVNVHPQVTAASALNQLVRVVTPQCLIFVLSDFSVTPLEDMQKSLIALRKQCKVVLLPIHDPSDSNIPDIGSLILQTDNQSTLIDTENLAARREYRAAWDLYVSDLTQMSKRFNTPLLWVETAQDPLRALYSKTFGLRLGAKTIT